MPLRLYVAGDGPNSTLARSNLATALDRLGRSGDGIEIVDCLTDARRALADGVMVTPTLVVEGDGGTTTVIGTLADLDRVVSILGAQEEST